MLTQQCGDGSGFGRLMWMWTPHRHNLINFSFQWQRKSAQFQIIKLEIFPEDPVTSKQMFINQSPCRSPELLTIYLESKGDKLANSRWSIHNHWQVPFKRPFFSCLRQTNSSLLSPNNHLFSSAVCTNERRREGQGEKEGEIHLPHRAIL